MKGEQFKDAGKALPKEVVRQLARHYPATLAEFLATVEVLPADAQGKVERANALALFPRWCSTYIVFPLHVSASAPAARALRRSGRARDRI